jgi:branched-chain amino acid transport system substrate-binding protein
MGADGLLSQTYVSLPETLGMYFSGPSGKASPAYDKLVATYTELFNEAPVQAFHAHAYDAVTLLLTKIAEVAEPQDDGSLHIDRRALRDAIYATSGYEGMTGTITCNEFGDCGAPGISVYQNADPAAGITGTMGNAVWP